MLLEGLSPLRNVTICMYNNNLASVNEVEIGVSYGIRMLWLNLTRSPGFPIEPCRPGTPGTPWGPVSPERPSFPLGPWKKMKSEDFS